VRRRLAGCVPVALLVWALTALLGCGGGSGSDGSTEPQSNTEPAKVEASKGGDPKPETTHRKEAPTRKGNRREIEGKPERTQHSERPVAHKPPPESRPNGCPAQLSVRQCGELDDAAAHPTSATPDSKNGCPVAMSRQLCQAAAQAQEEAEQSPSEARKPSECPDGLTQAQCAEVAGSIEAGAK
jgi:hypothetical protein